MFGYFHKRILRRHAEKNNLKVKSLIREAFLENSVINTTKTGVGNDKPHHIVISLTSFDKRIDSLHVCIESLFQQSLKADVIVLWLSRKNFVHRELPECLIKMQSRGLVIKWVEEDIGPYKKIIYSLREYNNSLIITVDDDVIYPVDAIDMLYQSYLKEPQAIHCHRAYHMQVFRGKAKPYKCWKVAGESSGPEYGLLPTGIAGVLYPPKSLHEDVTNQELFMRICPGADDVWLKAMSLMQGTKVFRVKDNRPWKSRFLTIEGSQASSLKKMNWKKVGGNDEKIAAVFEHYKLFDRYRF